MLLARAVAGVWDCKAHHVYQDLSALRDTMREDNDPWLVRQLFGGAVSLSVPARLVDVSDFRPVPDNQEVLADGATDQSVIVEIMVSSHVIGQGFIHDTAVSLL